MKRILFLLALLCMGKVIHAQYIYTIKADSVKITNSCDTAELIIENHSQTVPGFLFNKGRGRTEFRRVMQQINDTLVMIGPDTLRFPNAWMQGGNRFNTTGKFGTLDNNHIDFYTHDTLRGRWSNTGSLIIGGSADNGSKVRITGNSIGPDKITHFLFDPTVTTISTAPFTNFYGARFNPTLKMSANFQQAYAVDISPTYDLGNFQPAESSAALHVESGLGGIRIDQRIGYDTSAATTAQPLLINQDGSANVESIRNYRNGNRSTRAFIWNTDNRPESTKTTVVPAIRSTLFSSDAGSGVSFTLDRFYWPSEASIEMKYETPNTANVTTSIGFKTMDNQMPATPLFLLGGKVGIGITVPSAQLHTTGSVRFNGLTNDNSLTRVVVSDANGNLYYRDDSSLVMNERLNSDLAVNGTVSAQKMLISQTGRWPDYVFSKQYQLPSLSEVEKYINQNNHLPGIPSAAEVEKKGIDVANNQAALLKKIEELTLYIIEQEKTIKKQNDQIKDLLSLKQEMAELKTLIKGTSQSVK